jgi:hypothetical protein
MCLSFFFLISVQQFTWSLDTKHNEIPIIEYSGLAAIRNRR